MAVGLFNTRAQVSYKVPETLDLFNEVALLRRELEEHGVMLQALLRTQGRSVAAELITELRKDPIASSILLKVDGERSQGDILASLKASKIRGTSAAAVSRKVDKLRNDYHLITLVRRTKAGNVYRRTLLDKVLGVSRALEQSVE